MIVVQEGNTRNLIIGSTIIPGGTNRAGLYVNGNNLYFDGLIISNATLNSTGLTFTNDAIYFNGVIVSNDGGTPIVNYWNPPAQAEATTERDWTYAETIAAYDALMAANPTYITKKRYNDTNGDAILTVNGSYEMYSYEFAPASYSKTIWMQAMVHGNEKDSKVTMYRICEILANKTNQAGYTEFAPIRNDVRLIVIPLISPYGNDVSGLRVPYQATEFGINMNRNYDANQQYAVSSGVGGDPVFDMAEIRHVRDLMEEIDPRTVDYFMDLHDGGGVDQHYWIDYAVDSVARTLVNDFVAHLVEKYNVTDPVIFRVKDTPETGYARAWGSNTLGLTASTVEWMGGLFGYSFDSPMMTHAMDIRGNMLLIAYNNDTKEWRVNEPQNASYFHFDYPKAFSRDGLRLNGAGAETQVTDAKIYARWDALQVANPTKITKSAQLGLDVYGTQPIHTYTIGNGATKVLYVGGVMRYLAEHRIDEFAMYLLAEYLMDDFIVNQSVFLTDLRDNYTIIVLPCIDNIAGNSDPIREAGLNNTLFSYPKWDIVNGIAQPTTYALGNHDIPILKTIIDNNTDLKCIVSGGEIMENYSFNPDDYSTNYQAQFVIPKNMTSDIDAYKTHLETNRGELVLIENTQGVTFGDYAFDNHSIPTYFVQQKVSDRFTDRADDHTLTEDQYLHSNYEAGRRMANIVNLFIN